MNAPVTTAATIRGRAALDEVRGLLNQLESVDVDIAALDQIQHRAAYSIEDTTVLIGHGELQDVLRARRDAILNKLENKGIRIAPDPIAA